VEILCNVDLKLGENEIFDRNGFINYDRIRAKTNSYF
jgi:hypothetical protein